MNALNNKSCDNASALFWRSRSVNTCTVRSFVVSNLYNTGEAWFTNVARATFPVYANPYILSLTACVSLTLTYENGRAESTGAGQQCGGGCRRVPRQRKLGSSGSLHVYLLGAKATHGTRFVVHICDEAGVVDDCERLLLMTMRRPCEMQLACGE